MKTVTYSKPKMTDLKGKLGRSIVAQVRNNIVLSDKNIVEDAENCKKRLLEKRKNAK